MSQSSSPNEECAAGCQLEQARVFYARAQAILDTARKLAGHTENGEIVSQALWCDQGDHAFSSRDPQAEHWERQGTGADGKKISVPWDVCGVHMAAINNRLAAIEAEIKGPAAPPAAPAGQP